MLAFRRQLSDAYKVGARVFPKEASGAVILDHACATLSTRRECQYPRLELDPLLQRRKWPRQLESEGQGLAVLVVGAPVAWGRG